MYRRALIAGSISGMCSVILGAMGAHAVKQMVAPERLALFVKAAEYQFYHSFALLLCGIVYTSFGGRALRSATGLFLGGILLFSGSLYALTFVPGDLKALGAWNLITPLGGLLLIGGWAYMAIAFIQKRTA